MEEKLGSCYTSVCLLGGIERTALLAALQAAKCVANRGPMLLTCALEGVMIGGTAALSAGAEPVLDVAWRCDDTQVRN